MRALVLAAVAAALLCVAPLPRSSSAQEVDDATIGAGIQIFKTAANCWECHGWNGLGGLPVVVGDLAGMNPGPALVASKLDRAAMLEAITCGKPGSVHPVYSREAWTPRRPCYGKTRADLGPDETLPDIQVTLTEGQLQTVTAFVQAFYQGKPMTKAKCLRYFGVGRSIVCDPFP
ncbi:MAG: hypothetical protein FJX64_08765 [Alphaproteobacteria bacterium]|nr:hypothetical protein [Alphaproteobacteria bacterium]